MAIDFDLHDHLATITINRPERMNAMDTEHYNALSEAWTRVRDDPEDQVAIIYGAGEKSFYADADLESFVSQQPPLSSPLLTPLAVQSAKEPALRSRDVHLATGLRLEQMMMRLLQTSEDVVVGTAAFTEKRMPVFTAR